LIFLSATFSGLTLGLMGLDPYGLELIIKADPDAVEAKQAATILRYRKDGNLMLCTLLFGNVAVNALLPILLDTLLGEIGSIFFSTFALVIFGEITPQAVCSRYALAIGSRMIWLLVFFTVLLYIIAKPVALILDIALGEELGTIHNKNELVEIVRFHQEQGIMDDDEAKAVRGALLYSDVQVAKVMTKSELVFTLKENDPLNFEKISDIFRTGHSRLPVCSKDDEKEIVGILLTKVCSSMSSIVCCRQAAHFVHTPFSQSLLLCLSLLAKDLILVDPKGNMVVSDVLNCFKRPVVKVCSTPHAMFVLKAST